MRSYPRPGRRFAVALTLGLLLGARHALAAPSVGCGVDRVPLLDVVLTSTDVRPRPPYPTEIGQTVAFIYRANQAALSQLSTAVTNGVTADASSTFVCGMGRSGPWTVLNDRLTALLPGLAKSCRVTNAAPSGLRLTIVWHGRATRQNTFVLDSANDTLPECSPQASDFLDAVAAYLSAVVPVDTFGKLP